MPDSLQGILIHPVTRAHITAFLDDPVHGLLVTGPRGSGKLTIARILCGGLLGITLADEAALHSHPYVRVVSPVEGKAIPIESIRELQHFLSLRIPGQARGAKASRVIIIENAYVMSTEAQNALLKTLEEPPQGTYLVLTSTTLDAVLPTIQSRVRELTLTPPALADSQAHFAGLGYPSKQLSATLSLTGGLPGLTAALLSQDESHPLYTATTHARGILQSKSYERLLLVDSLAKQKELCQDVLYVLGRMAQMGLAKAGTMAAADRWQRIQRATYEADRQLRRSVQAKLVLTNLMLAL